MTKAIRADAHASISLPDGWDSENTVITFSVLVERKDTGELLGSDQLEVEIDDVQEQE